MAVKRPRLTAALLVVVLLLALVWALRLRIATTLVDRRLAEAGVPATYRITRIGPFLQRMEDVRIGDAARPDLVARRIDVTIGYGLTGPVVRKVAVDGVDLAARIDPQGLHLGAIDRLLPKTGGKTALPDLDVDLRDVRLALGTPNGAIRVALAGRGNPMRQFGGQARAEAGLLRLASCSLSGVTADLAVSAAGGAPRVAGPVRVAGTGCPDLALGAGTLGLEAASNAAFDRVSVRARPTGFGGAAGPARFASMEGTIAAAGALGHLDARGNVTLRRFALPDQARAIGGLAIPAGLPVTPTAARASWAVARLLSDATATASFSGLIEGLGASVRVRRLLLAGADGARVEATGGEGIAWAPEKWSIDTDVTSGGGALPALRLRVRQAGAGAPLIAEGQVAPYAGDVAGSAFALPKLRVAWDGRGADVRVVAAVDGPLGSGFVRGLTAPIEGRIGADGRVLLNAGCKPVAFRALSVAGFTLDPATLRLCGRPLVARTKGGTVRIDAALGPVRLTGKSGSAPILLTASAVRVTERGMRLTDLGARLGTGEAPTRATVAALDGAFGAGGIAGRFSDADGAIANVPLDLKGAAGDWSLRGGALRVAGGLQVSDQAAAPRFLPLDARDVTLGLVDGRIAATGILRQPARGSEVARVTLAHDLSAGTGHADLAVRGITFVPKGLQPEMLTPLTLGVVANVAGTVTGEGRIDWSPAGVTSRGRFATDKLDLAAAFGPVSGIRGEIVFTDLLGLVTASHQTATIAEINTGVLVSNGTVHYRLIGDNRVVVEDALWPFAGGQLLLDPATLDFGSTAERRMTFRVAGMDAAAFVQQLDFPNLAATGTFDGALPMVFDQAGGRIEKGYISARKGGGTLAYVGELSSAQIGTMGKIAFDALKAIRYSALDISLDGRLDGEMVSNVRFTGVREATPEQSLITRLIRDLPFRFNIAIRAPFRGLVGTARAYLDPSLLLQRVGLPDPAAPAPATSAPKSPIQPPESGDVR